MLLLLAERSESRSDLQTDNLSHHLPILYSGNLPSEFVLLESKELQVQRIQQQLALLRLTDHISDQAWCQVWIPS